MCQSFYISVYSSDSFSSSSRILNRIISWCWAFSSLCYSIFSPHPLFSHDFPSSMPSMTLPLILFSSSSNLQLPYDHLYVSLKVTSNLAYLNVILWGLSLQYWLLILTTLFELVTLLPSHFSLLQILKLSILTDLYCHCNHHSY